jgi:hypothetical protein
MQYFTLIVHDALLWVKWHLLEYSSKGFLLTTRIIKLEPKLALVGMILDKK